MRDELEYNFKFSFEVQGVSEFEEDSHAHVDDGDDDRYFHFEVVDKYQFVVGDTPYRVNTERINAVSFGFDVYILNNNIPVEFIARSKDIDIHAKKIVVDPSAVKSEETHHQNHVAQLADKSQRSFS